MFGKFFKSKSLVNVVKLSGVISADGSKSLNLDRVKPQIDKAFSGSAKATKAVAFVINSPGGSPVQSELIANYVMSKSIDTKIPVICFIEDVAASGGYWLALMGNDIYALSSSSIVGSIGVVSASFGLDKFIEHYNITRRIYTAGKNKVMNDMFTEEKPENVERLTKLLNQIHIHFKEWVLKRRANKLSLSEEDLFNGDFWLASEAIKFGLIDKISTSLEEEIKDLYGEGTKINYIPSKKPSFVSKLMGLSSNNALNSSNLVNSVVETIEEKAHYSKYGM